MSDETVLAEPVNLAAVPLKILVTVRRDGREILLETVHSTIPVSLVLITRGAVAEGQQPPTAVKSGETLTEASLQHLLLSSLLPQLYTSATAPASVS